MVRLVRDRGCPLALQTPDRESDTRRFPVAFAATSLRRPGESERDSEILRSNSSGDDGLVDPAESHQDREGSEAESHTSSEAHDRNKDAGEASLHWRRTARFRLRGRRPDRPASQLQSHEEREGLRKIPE